MILNLLGIALSSVLFMFAIRLILFFMLLKVKKRPIDDSTVILRVSDEEESATISFPNPLFAAPLSLE